MAHESGSTYSKAAQDQNTVTNRKRRCAHSHGPAMVQQFLAVLFIVVATLLSQIIVVHGTNLGSKCQHDMDCTDFIKGSTCSANGYCECAPYFVQYDASTCLSSQLLGGDCLLDDQCTMKVANSSCSDGACRCVEGFLQFRKHTCLGPALPGAVCYSHAHCQMFDERTHCDFLIPNLFGRCQCTAPTKLYGGLCVDPIAEAATTEPEPAPTTTTEPKTTSTTIPTPVVFIEQETPEGQTAQQDQFHDSHEFSNTVDDSKADTAVVSLENENTLTADQSITTAPLTEIPNETTVQHILTPADVTTEQQEQLSSVSPAVETVTEDYPYKFEDEYAEEQQAQQQYQPEETQPTLDQSEQLHEVASKVTVPLSTPNETSNLNKPNLVEKPAQTDEIQHQQQQQPMEYETQQLEDTDLADDTMKFDYDAQDEYESENEALDQMIEINSEQQFEPDQEPAHSEQHSNEVQAQQNVIEENSASVTHSESDMEEGEAVEHHSEDVAENANSQSQSDVDYESEIDSVLPSEHPELNEEAPEAVHISDNEAIKTEENTLVELNEQAALVNEPNNVADKNDNHVDQEQTGSLDSNASSSDGQETVTIQEAVETPEKMHSQESIALQQAGHPVTPSKQSTEPLESIPAIAIPATKPDSVAVVETEQQIEPEKNIKVSSLSDELNHVNEKLTEEMNKIETSDEIKSKDKESSANDEAAPAKPVTASQAQGVSAVDKPFAADDTQQVHDIEQLDVERPVEKSNETFVAHDTPESEHPYEKGIVGVESNDDDTIASAHLPVETGSGDDTQVQKDPLRDPETIQSVSETELTDFDIEQHPLQAAQSQELLSQNAELSKTPQALSESVHEPASRPVEDVKPLDANKPNSEIFATKEPLEIVAQPAQNSNVNQAEEPHANNDDFKESESIADILSDLMAEENEEATTLTPNFNIQKSEPTPLSHDGNLRVPDLLAVDSSISEEQYTTEEIPLAEQNEIAQVLVDTLNPNDAINQASESATGTEGNSVDSELDPEDVLEHTLSPEEMPFDMSSIDDIQPQELQSDNLVTETSNIPEQPSEITQALETQKDESLPLEAEKSGDAGEATANPGDIIEITTQTMLGLASRVTLMEPAAPVATTLKPLMATPSVTEEIGASEIATSEPQKNVSNDHITNTEGVSTSNSKPLTEIRKRVDLGLEAVSLGLNCINDKQCQLADPHSICNQRGVCDCSVAPATASDAETLATTLTCNAQHTGCSKGTFQCRSSGVCISWFFVCDGREDCNDASDEECTHNARLNQTCPSEAFLCSQSGRCISRAALCDGRKQCPHGEDELGCSGVLRSTDGATSCPPHTFRCNSGECLPEYEYCNAIISCKDGSDEPPHLCGERMMPNFFQRLLKAGGLISSTSDSASYCPHRCSNGRCRSTAIVCSGRDGCGDGTDEQTCAVCRCPAPTGLNIPAYLARQRPMPLW